MPAETEGKEFDDVDWGSPDSETWSLQKLQKKPNRSSTSDLGNARAKNTQQEPAQRRDEPCSAKAQNKSQFTTLLLGGTKWNKRPNCQARLCFSGVAF